MSYALFLLNAQAQLQDSAKADTIAHADIIVCDAAMDTQAIRAHTNATLLSYWSAKALFMGASESAFWNGIRSRLLDRKRPQGTPAFIYDAGSYGGAPVDPGDSTPHLLIEPTLENAEALAREVNSRVAAASFDGVYIDDCWVEKPPRLRKSSADSIRWACYLQSLFLQIPGAWANCGGKPAAAVTRISCECPGTPPIVMTKLALMNGEGRRHIYWYGAGVDGLYLEGRLL